MKTSLALSVAFATLFAAGCGSSGSDDPSPSTDTSGDIPNDGAIPNDGFGPTTPTDVAPDPTPASEGVGGHDGIPADAATDTSTSTDISGDGGTENENDGEASGGVTIDLDNYERVLREVIAIVNREPLDAVLVALPDVGDIGTSDPGAGLTLGSREDGVALEALPQLRYPGAFPESWNQAVRLDETSERYDYVCDAGGEFVVLVPNQGGGGGNSYRSHSSCVFGDAVIDGTVFRRDGAHRPARRC